MSILAAFLHDRALREFERTTINDQDAEIPYQQLLDSCWTGIVQVSANGLREECTVSSLSSILLFGVCRIISISNIGGCENVMIRR